MSNKSTQLQLSKEEFHRKLLDTLKRNGVTDTLKSQLRSRLIQELCMRTNLDLALKNVYKDSKSHGSSNSSSKHTSLVESLIWEYLSKSQYEYTLSVFGPESRISSAKVIEI